MKFAKAKLSQNISIDIEHYNIHEGDYFRISVEKNGLNIGDTSDIVFKTPDTSKKIHLVIEYVSTVTLKVELLEDAVWTSTTGTEKTIINHDLNKLGTLSTVLQNKSGAFVADGKVLLDPTVTDPGTIKWDSFKYSSSAVGGGKRGNNEMILKKDTNYLIRLTSGAAGNSTHLILNWYEDIVEVGS